MITHSFWELFRGYAEVFSAWLFIPLNREVTLVLIANLLASIVFRRQSPEKHLHAAYALAYGQFLFVPALLVTGVLGRSPGPERLEVWATATVWIFVAGAQVLGLYFLVRLRGIRWFAASLWLLQVWLTSAAAYVASGDWI